MRFLFAILCLTIFAFAGKVAVAQSTPKESMVKFLEAWKKQDFAGVKKVASRLDPFKQSDFKEFFVPKKIVSYQLTGERKANKVAYLFTVRINYKLAGKLRSGRLMGIVMREDAKGMPDARGSWAVNPYSMIRER